MIYLANHGMVALDTSQVQALQITEMADKVSRVLATASLVRGTVHASSAPTPPSGPALQVSAYQSGSSITFQRFQR